VRTSNYPRIAEDLPIETGAATKEEGSGELIVTDMTESWSRMKSPATTTVEEEEVSERLRIAIQKNCNMSELIISTTQAFPTNQEIPS